MCPFAVRVPAGLSLADFLGSMITRTIGSVSYTHLRNKLFQTGQGTERVNDNLTDVAVTTEEQLAFRDITRIVGHGMSCV